MSFIRNLLFGGVKTSEDPTGVVQGSSTPTINEASQPIIEGKFYPRTIYKFNGHDDEKIFIAVKGKVFDCTQGRQFYGPSGPYSNFAGHDASRGLATNSFELDTLRHWDQPIDDLKDLTTQDLQALDGWLEHFEKKYPCVGSLEAEPGVNI
ncbi:LAMI_0F03774g1_1 [Lachancea mirantina]|uniref:LAMI_0F03774g1_1 n=1 Tax=Lachancea mirantina TaxID=1230905 RepID=A0A1G4JXG3_9SACH|nr:LAMI_0F03774g1_1 [Lachancea mirantina]